MCACSSSAPATPSGSWLMYRGDLSRDGHAPSATLDSNGAATLALSWRAHLDGAVDGTPAVARGMVVAGTAAGTLAALSATSGRVVWSAHGLGAISSSPTVDGDSVYVATLTGRAYAFDLRRGKQLWSWTAPTNSALWASPVVYRDEVIIGVGSQFGDEPLVAGRLLALSASTGNIIWTMCLRAGCALGDGMWSTPAIDAHGIAFVGVGNPDDGVLAFNAMTGQRKWFTSLYPDHGRDLDVGASPLLFTLDGKEAVAQATNEGMLAVLDAASGAVLWSRELVAGSAVHGLLASPAYNGTSLFVASASPPTGVFAIDPSDGSTRWRYQADLPVYSAPAVGNGVVVFGTGAVFGDVTTGSVVATSAKDGRRRWQFDAHSAVRSGPALVGDFLIVGDVAGDVLTFRPNA